MYTIYTDREFVKQSPSLATAQKEAVRLYKERNENIYVWREQKGKKSELILEVIDETKE
jgi:hypothetical protein